MSETPDQHNPEEATHIDSALQPPLETSPDMRPPEGLRDIEALRVSCSGYARIKDPVTHRLGLLRHERGDFTPVGGSLEATSASFLNAQSRFVTISSGGEGGTPVLAIVMLESERHPKDLRFTTEASIDSIAGITSWFVGGTSREGPEGVLREVMEELGPDENGPLSQEDIARLEQAAVLERAGIHGALRMASNPGGSGRPTLALSEVYDLTLPIEILDRLRAISDGTDPSFIFASPAEIRSGQTASGLQIASNSLAMLDFLQPEEWQDDPNIVFLRLGGSLHDPNTGKTISLPPEK